MVYSVTHEKKSKPSKVGLYSESNLTLVKSAEYPKMDKVKALLKKLYGDDVDDKTIKITSTDMPEDGGGIHNLD